MRLVSGQKKGRALAGPPLVTGATRDQLRSARPARVPVVASLPPEDEPIEEPLPEVPDEPDVLGDELLVSLLLEPLADGELEPLDEPVPDAPMLELEGEELLEVEGEVLLEEPVDGEAPIVLLPLAPLLPEVVGALEPVELGEVLLVLPVVGVLLLVPVPLPLVEPAPALPADVPALPPDVPPVWATA